MRATMYTPAVTMVAAWIRALTGVGPSIASGSQTYSGICADLPVAPTKRSKRNCRENWSAERQGVLTDQRGERLDDPGKAVGSARPFEVKRIVPNVVEIRKMPSRNPVSPMRLTMNAFLPASEADFLRK